MNLRPYQADALDGVRASLRAGHRRVILSGPTGSGKTNMAGEMIAAAIAKGSRTLFVADRRVLVGQASRRLNAMGLDHGVIMSGTAARVGVSVDVASAQTLEKRLWWSDPTEYPLSRPYDLIVVDEAHDRRAATERFLVSTGTPAVGLTATPMTRGLGGPLKDFEEAGPIWQDVVNVRATNDLISDGWLVPFETWICTEIDMDGAKTVAGEWTKDEVGSRALPITGNIVSEWVSHTRRAFGGPVPTIVFSSSVAHGDELRQQFADAGHRFEQISYKDRDPQERDAKIAAMASGEAVGLISCEALAKGFDETSIRCVVMARPYRRALHAVIQALGRGMRAHPGKDRCLLLDHSGNMKRFASDLEIFWQNGVEGLDDGSKKRAPPRNDAKDRDRQCFGCGFFMPRSATACPECGKPVPKPPPRTIVRPGRMVRYESLITEVGDLWPHISRLALDHHPDDRAKAEKYAKAQYKNLTGSWPAWGRDLEPADYCDHRVADAVQAEYRKWRRRQWAIERGRAQADQKREEARAQRVKRRFADGVEI